MPASVALSLGLYFAEHNRGAFKNHFIEFSAEPRLIEIKGETFADKLAPFTDDAKKDLGVTITINKCEEYKEVE